jgi:hypothetical protein
MERGISACRLCENTELAEIIDLGVQAMSDVFPKARSEQVAAWSLKLVRCTGDSNACGLLQLAHAQGGNPSTMAGEFPLRMHDGAHTDHSKPRSALAAAVQSSGNPANVLVAEPGALSTRERPLQYLRQVRDALDHGSVCVFEEHYMPAMLQRNAYDRIRHEQLAYCGLRQIKWMIDTAKLKIIDVEFEGHSAGSVSVAVARHEFPRKQCHAVERILDEEARAGLHTLNPYRDFAERVTAGIELLRTFLDRARTAGKTVNALGASREGNVILQSCHVTQTDIGQIGETDPEKVGAFTPGTLLPIVAEEDVLAMQSNFLLVLPWQMRGMLLRQRKLLGRNVLFPLPKLEFVRAASS